jgi:hypothetical protein
MPTITFVNVYATIQKKINCYKSSAQTFLIKLSQIKKKKKKKTSLSVNFLENKKYFKLQTN